jgi:AAA family ATP:ADP antiporter
MIGMTTSREQPRTFGAALREMFPVRRDEYAFALPLLAYFFLVITTFWILKPLKKGLFIGFYRANGIDVLGAHLTAAQGELVAKVANMAVALVAVIAFSRLARTLRRQELTEVFAGFFTVAFALLAWAVARPSGAVAWAFYLLGDLYSTLMVATFFSFVSDSVDTDRAKRLYGVIGLGGVAGGAFGSSVVTAAVRRLSPSMWLLVTIAIGVVIVVLARIAARAAPIVQHTAADDPKASVALEGARLVSRSRYLLAIVTMVGVYEMVSTIMDFQFTATVQRALEGPALSMHFARVFAVTNWVALLVQLFATTYVMRRFGLTIALLVLPIAAATGTVAFLAVPTVWSASALNTADNAFNYSIQQSAKEALYVPTTRREKYMAKAFIDMFVQRVAKAVAVVVSLLISTVVTSISGLRVLSIATLVLLSMWIVAAVIAGRTFAEKEA